MGEIVRILDIVVRETMLFAAAGLLIGGLDDILVDLCFIVPRVLAKRRSRIDIAALPTPVSSGRIAIFIGAWDEAAVIGQMLRTASSRLPEDTVRFYVGVYPNDPATIDAVAKVAETDPRIRLIVGPRAGPTTKADNLNQLWRAALADEASDNVPIKAVLLHDAEDVVHPDEVRVVDALIEGRSVVQLPVLPLVKRGSRLVSGHYADEFAYAHGLMLVVRTALGAGLPLAGTGCAIARDALAAIAAERGGDPFDASSLTEDYELGLRLAQGGGRSLFARVDDADGNLIAVRAYFPDTVPASVRQKARWMTGIALAGWDRTGWARGRAFGDHWMRMRDRRAPLGVLVLAVAYVAALAWGLSMAVHAVLGTLPPDDALAAWLLGATTGLFVWRLAMRTICTARTYGWREARWSLPRFFVGNVVALVAAPRALVIYWRLLRGGKVVWDKTAHAFPDLSTLPA